MPTTYQIRRITSWQSGEMALRWTAGAIEETSRNWRRILACQQLWMLDANLKNQDAGATRNMATSG